MRKVILALSFLIHHLVLQSQPLSIVESVNKSGKVFFKIQSRKVITDFLFNGRYTWYSNYENRLEIVLNKPLENIILLKIDDNHFNLDRIQVSIQSLENKKIVKLKRKNFEVIKIDGKTILKIDITFMDLPEGKLRIECSYKIGQEENFTNFKWLVNTMDFENFTTKLEFIVPEYFEYHENCSYPTNLEKNQKTLNESFTYIPFVPGKLTNKLFNYTSASLIYETKQNSLSNGDNYLEFNLIMIRPIPITD